MDCKKERTEDVIINEANVHFESLFLSPPVLQALKENSFTKPSPIQLKAIPLGKCGLDLIVKSKSGTGKTAVFAIIALEMIDVTKQNLQVLILAPTREIAVQSCDVINTIGKHIKDLKIEHFIGGLPVKEDVSKAKGCHIAVASPGRILHLITSDTLDVQHVKLFVLDEADSLVESNFQADINRIFHNLPQNKQMLAVSATFPNELDTFLSKYMHVPTYVSHVMDTPLLLGLKHFVTITPFNTNVLFLTKFKNTELLRLLTQVSFTQCLVFCNYQTRAEEVTSYLHSNGWKADYISGAQTQKQRLEVLKTLKEFQCRILLSTDLTARGIDAVNVDLVINYDVPNDESTYLHRMGRAGRYGSRGICITIAAKGAEVSKFCDLIGAIGGCEMIVPILPKDELPDKIWEADIQKFSKLQGSLKHEINGKGMKESIRKSVKEVLRGNANNVAENEVVNRKTMKQKSIVQQKDHKKVVDEIEVNDQQIAEQNDTTALLALLAAGRGDDASVSKVDSDKASIFNKNMSLLTVSSLLDDDDLDVSNDQTVKTIESFITKLQEPDLTIPEEVSSLEDSSMISTSAADISLVDIEDVFSHAFNSAVCKTKPHWADLYEFEDSKEEESEGKPVNLLQDLLEYVSKQVNPEDADCDYIENDEEEYYDYYENQTAYFGESEEAPLPSMEWMPVQNDGHNANTNEGTLKQVNANIPKQDVILINNHDNMQHYEQLFDGAVQHLDKTFNTLESAPAFESMWTQWQRQITSVRDYVQQNIYLNEMATYRGNIHQ